MSESWLAAFVSAILPPYGLGALFKRQRLIYSEKEVQPPSLAVFEIDVDDVIAAATVVRYAEIGLIPNDSLASASLSHRQEGTTAPSPARI